MRLPRETYQIQQTIETHLPHLSQPQLAGLVLWVCGAILAGSACQNAVASALSPWRSWNNLRQYLREWLYDGSGRARPCKTQLDVTLCFAPLLRWVLTWWRSGRLALAVDPTLKGDQTTAIVISVLYRGCAIPVAWSIRRATQPGSWMDPTVELLKELAPTLRLPSRHGLDRTGHHLRRPLRPTPLHPAGGLVRPAGGTLDHPHRPASPGSGTQLVRSPFLDRAGLQSLPPATTGGPSRAWAGNGRRPAGPIRSEYRAIGWCCRWQHCWHWPTGPGWKTPMTGRLPPAACARRPGRWRPLIAAARRSRDGPSA